MRSGRGSTGTSRGQPRARRGMARSRFLLLCIAVVSDPWIASLLVLLFFGATWLTDRLQPRVAWVPLALLSVGLFLVFRELARYDLGHADLLNAVGLIGAPVGAILGGAAWGTRRFYGWPDLGPHPSRLGLASAAVLLGVLLGTRTRDHDVADSQRVAETLRLQVLAWRASHADAWPTTLEQAVPAPPRTHMGTWDPPAFALATAPDGRRVLRFPLSTTRAYALGLEDGRWSQGPRSETAEAP